MVVVGTILFAFYLAAGTALSVMLELPLLPVLLGGLLIVPPLQYKLGKWMATRKAEEIPPEATGRYGTVRQMTLQLADEMGVPEPTVMRMSMGVPNAFAVGRKGAGVVVVSEELVSLLDRDELEGVLAHELAHIKNRDVVTMVIGQSIGMLVGYREYVADADARRAIGAGDPLARALEKISRGAEGRESEIDDNMSALCILNTDRGLFEKLFSTHPPMEKRIQRLRN